ncbi:MAG: hypothetical protein V1790_17385 [Planctomycetota bacterium]
MLTRERLAELRAARSRNLVISQAERVELFDSWLAWELWRLHNNGPHPEERDVTRWQCTREGTLVPTYIQACHPTPQAAVLAALGRAEAKVQP